MSKIMKFGKDEFKIEFANKVTMKSKSLNKLLEVEGLLDNPDDFINKIDELYFHFADLLLVGLQKYHADEFPCNYDNMEGYETSIEKVNDLLEAYFEDEESDFIKLFTELQEEVLANGFLASVFRKMKQLTEQTEKTEKKASSKK